MSLTNLVRIADFYRGVARDQQRRSTTEKSRFIVEAKRQLKTVEEKRSPPISRWSKAGSAKMDISA